MNSAAESAPPSPAPAAAPKPYRGEVVYLFAFDIAYDMTDQPLTQLLGQPVVSFRMDVDKRTPRQRLFYEPQMICLPVVTRVGPHGPVPIERMVKVLPVGAISLAVCVPFAVDRIEELVSYHDLETDAGPLNDEVRRLAEEVRLALQPYCIRPRPDLPDEEAYTVFCLEAPLTGSDGRPVSAESWLQGHRREVAALLTQETDIQLLSRQETEETIGRALSYYQSDLAVLDWNAALLVDEPVDMDEALYVIELANLQLAELEAYDQMLDSALDRSYRDIAGPSPRRRSEVLKEIKEMRIDLARLSDELSNITKFFGDWHLARVYRAMAARFHLPEWHHTIDDKLKTLDDFYQVLRHERDNRWMLVLEATIVLLFIIDLVILAIGLK
jgi:hypothetical protein